MSRTSGCFMQALESRTFLSAAPVMRPPVPRDPPPRPPIDQPNDIVQNEDVAAAREALRAATDQLRRDQMAGRRTIGEDQKAVRTEFQKLIDDQGAEAVNAAIQPLKDELRADEIAKNKELRTAGEELRIAKRKARQLIGADLQALAEATQANDQEAIDAAKDKLEADRAQIQEDLEPIRTNIMAIKDRWRPIITADHQAIEDKLVELDPALAPLYDKLNEDAAALQAKLAADTAVVADAAEKLKQAIQDAMNTATA